MTTVTLTNLEKRYPNGYQAISTLNLSIEQGEMVVLVGPSGCGKSTLLRMIAGLETITDGDLLIDNRRVNEHEPSAMAQLRSRRKRNGYSPRKSKIFPV